MANLELVHPRALDWYNARPASTRCQWCWLADGKHTVDCDGLHEQWAVRMPFGKHKGQPIAQLDSDYLRWAKINMSSLGPEERDEIVRVLGAVQ